jgi:hypothetical protein
LGFQQGWLALTESVTEVSKFARPRSRTLHLHFLLNGRLIMLALIEIPLMIRRPGSVQRMEMFNSITHFHQLCV